MFAASILKDEVLGYKQRNGAILGTERTAHISHTLSPRWLMPLWKEAEMTVARIHGKVKCRPFKGKRRRAPFTKHGVTLCFMFSSSSELDFLFLSKGRRLTQVLRFSVLAPSPRNRQQWLAVSKGLNLFEWALWTADPMVRQLWFYWCNPCTQLIDVIHSNGFV